MKKVFYEVFSFSSIKLCAHNKEMCKRLNIDEVPLHMVYPEELGNPISVFMGIRASRVRAEDLGWKCDEKDRI